MVSRFLLQHHWNDMSREQKSGTDVGVHHLVVFRRAGGDKVLVIPHARVVDQDVNASERLDGNLDGFYCRRFLARVAGDDHDFASGRFRLLFQLFKSFPAAGGENEVGTGADKRPCTGPADACARTRDERHFA